MFTPRGVAAEPGAGEDDLLPMAPRLNRNVARSLLALSYPIRMAAHLTRRP